MHVKCVSPILLSGLHKTSIIFLSMAILSLHQHTQRIHTNLYPKKKKKNTQKKIESTFSLEKGYNLDWSPLDSKILQIRDLYVFIIEKYLPAPNIILAHIYIKLLIFLLLFFSHPINKCCGTNAPLLCFKNGHLEGLRSD